MYRADWEPAAASRRHTGGVLGVSWRYPTVYWGPSTPSPTWDAGKTRTSKNWPISPICRWKWGESAPCGQGHLWRPNGPQYAKSHVPFGSPPHQGLRNCDLSQKKIFHSFRPFFRAHQGAFCGLRRWPYFVAGRPFRGSSRTREAKCN